MKRRFTVGIATLAAAGGLAVATPAVASAAPVQPTPAGAFGSVSLCFGIPIGPVTISVCI